MDRKLIAAILRLMAPLKRRVAMMVGRAVIEAIDDSGGLQRCKLMVLRDEVHDGVERFQNYGFTANPPDGAEAIVVSVLGHRDHMIVIALDHRGHRLVGLAKGEAAMFSEHGQTLIMKADGSVELKCSGDMTIDAPNLKVTGDILDNAGTNTNTIALMRAIFNAHIHPQSGGGNTGTPASGM